MNAAVEQELLDIPEGYELVGGQLADKNVGTKAGWVGGNVLAQLLAHCNQHHLGWVFPSEVAYRCFSNRKTARKPYASFLRKGCLPDEQLPDGDLKIVPDLAVEVVSPNDTFYEVSEKVEEYLAAGVRLVWVIDPKCRLAIVHRQNGSMVKVREGQDLDGEDVLPGFRCPLATCLPSPEHQSNGEGQTSEG